MPNKARNKRKEALLNAIAKEGKRHPSFVEGPLRPTKAELLSSLLKFFR